MCTLALFRSDGAHADGARAARLPQHREALAAGGGAPAPRLSDVHARKGGAPVRLRAQALPRGARLPAQSGRRGLRPRGQGPPPHERRTRETARLRSLFRLQWRTRRGNRTEEPRSAAPAAALLQSLCQRVLLHLRPHAPRDAALYEGALTPRLRRLAPAGTPR